MADVAYEIEDARLPTSDAGICVRESLSQREREARASGQGEGYHRYFFNLFSFCTPHPPLRGTLSGWERDLPETFS
jgi:hypothetical protein